jgi:hypothetical protein
MTTSNAVGPPTLTIPRPPVKMHAMSHALMRSGLVLAGLLLLAVGLGNMVAGHSKIAQYEDLVQATVPRIPHDPLVLFPAVSEGEERHALAGAKLAFYQLLVSAGQLLVGLGGFLIAIGVLRVWMRAPRASVDSPLPN